MLLNQKFIICFKIVIVNSILQGWILKLLLSLLFHECCYSCYIYCISVLNDNLFRYDYFCLIFSQNKETFLHWILQLDTGRKFLSQCIFVPCRKFVLISWGAPENSLFWKYNYLSMSWYLLFLVSFLLIWKFSL